ncbi:unnamed protein product [Mytilus edulis]|uniref:Endonuclease/exonuclease/phosphatase domain-containing protein n=1 Tax=Mytilus edulis TaxID=6550 RepID=A0A8S3SL85_MYTED|nr:unnamed protein product [Mytilus edulis]
MFSPLPRTDISIDSDFNTSVFSQVHTSSQKFSGNRHSRNSKRSSNLTQSTNSNNSNVLQLPPKGNLRIMTVICRSIIDKKAQLSASIHYNKPDIICGTESLLKGFKPGKPMKKDAIKSSEVFPDNFKITRNDTGTLGGGIVLGIHEDLISTEFIKPVTDCEIEWAKIKLKSSKDRFTASYYMPHRNMKDITKLSLEKITIGKPKHIIIAGDFNCPDVDWITMEIKTGASDKEVQQALMDLSFEHGLVQIHDKPTREGNLLDLVFTNNPSLIKSTGNAPGISDNDIVITDLLIKPCFGKQTSSIRTSIIIFTICQ